MRVKLSYSPNQKKKYRILFPNGKTVDFGAKSYEDFTTHKDETRKQRYLARHAKREDWLDPYTAGFWSKWLLWSRDNLTDAINDVRKIFNIDVI
jgi:hypothetical protein